MSTRRTLYKDKRIIRNGTTTIVYGINKFKSGTDLADASVKLYIKLYDLITGAFSSGYESKGVAKLDPADTYSDATGKTVASSKAEVRGNKALRNDLKNLLKLVKSYENILTETIEDLEVREAKINSIER